MAKKLTLFFTIKEFEKIHLYKDVGLVPYYLGKEYDLDVDIVYCNKEKKEIPKKFRDISLIEIPYYKTWKIIKKIEKFQFFENINFYKYLLKNAKKINYLMFFHMTVEKFFLIFLYKYLNPNGKIYLKLDMSEKSIKNLNKKRIGFFRKKMLEKIDLISCESKDSFIEINQNGFNKIKINDKISLVFNGFDEEYLIRNKIKIKSFEEKENIMITVGRIGTEQKNNEMLLAALTNIDLKNWKIYIIGPFTKKFKIKYDEFIKNNQDKKENVILIGNIEDKNLLYDYYNKAKIFLLTSRWESFGIVLSEALRFGDYIISTNVGAAKDITDNGRIGIVTEIEDILQFKNEILKVINNKVNLQEKYKESLELSKKQFLWNEIVKNRKFKEFFNEME